ncbi:MAG: DEAD/DEAH box helicase family protein [Gammaproteobacteria bacterium]|nr:DEAD/DEAH box helicase family protein [Gammaproteobacteria bacterium]
MATQAKRRPTATAHKRKGKAEQAARPRRVSPLHEPEDMTVEAWQVALRRQFGREQDFELLNLGNEPIFSEFQVTNPASGGAYRVAIRGEGLGENFCSCPDFATNELGTCKHIEFTLGRLERKRGGKRAFRTGFEPEFSEIWLRYGVQRQVCFRPGRDCPPALLRRAGRLFDASGGWVLPQNRFGELAAFVRAAQRAGHALRVYDDVRGLVTTHLDAQARVTELARLYPEGPSSPALQALLRQKLYPYQAEGALFAARAGSAIIADEMGLGKTIQALAAAELLRRHFHVTRAVIVCPTSLTGQWASEIERFSGRSTQVVSGNKSERARLYAAPSEYLILSYDTLIRDFELVVAWQPDLLIADEAQRIKNWNTRAARFLKRLPTRHAFVLTGTPLENRLEELLSIVQLVDRARLGPTWRFLREHQLRDDSGRVTGYQKLDAIGRTLAPIMIRRRRQEVLTQLPERSEKTWFVPLTRQQLEVHAEQQDIVARIVAKWRRQRFLSDADQKRLMSALQTMRMVSNSTYLIDPATDHGNKLDEILAVISELLEEPDTKVVVFSAWLKMHELLARAFDTAGWQHVWFHGGVPGKKRGSLVARFRDDPACRIFLATDSGGVGLNLQHATAVVNVDLPWNPAVLKQRIGRVHRLGQQSPVRVENFVAEEGIERRILALLDFKESMFAGALDGGAATVSLEGTRLSRFMEGVEQLTADRQPGSHPGKDEAPGKPPVPEAEIPPGPTPMPETTAASRPSSGIPENPWQPLLELGARVLSELARDGASADALIEQDPTTGQRYVKLPVPDADAVAQLANALRAFLPRS